MGGNNKIITYTIASILVTVIVMIFSYLIFTKVYLSKSHNINSQKAEVEHDDNNDDSVILGTVPKDETISNSSENVLNSTQDDALQPEVSNLDSNNITDDYSSVEVTDSSAQGTSVAENHNPIETTSIANTEVAMNSSQIITVVSNGGSNAELVLWQKDTNNNWSQYDSCFAYLGSGGMKYCGDVYEMDMCTPTGCYSLTEAFGINSNPGSGVPYRVLDGSEYWVDDENSEYYNTMQFGDPNGRWNSAEHLSSFGTAYNYSIVIDYNRWPVIPGKSSAIFLHVSTGKPTWGCVAIDENMMIEVLNWIDPNQNPIIILDFSYDSIYSNY